MNTSFVKHNHLLTLIVHILTRKIIKKIKSSNETNIFNKKFSSLFAEQSFIVGPKEIKLILNSELGSGSKFSIRIISLHIKAIQVPVNLANFVRTVCI